MHLNVEDGKGVILDFKIHIMLFCLNPLLCWSPNPHCDSIWRWDL
jgi:hypothetical protein